MKSEWTQTTTNLPRENLVVDTKQNDDSKIVQLYRHGHFWYDKYTKDRVDYFPEFWRIQE